MNDDGPKTLIEAVRYFADEAVCMEHMKRIKWPDGKPVCPKCASDNIGVIATRNIFKCRACKKQFSCKVDTIFEQSQLGLSKWFVAVWMIANCKNGVSSLELHRALGITQKSAWFMLHRIRLAMRMHGVVMPEQPKQPSFGGEAFDTLARKLAQVPRPLVDAAERRYEKRKKQRKRKKKS